MKFWLQVFWTKHSLSDIKKSVEIMEFAQISWVFSESTNFTNISSRRVSRADGGGGLRNLCIKKGYSEPSQTESWEGSSTVAESSRVT